MIDQTIIGIAKVGLKFVIGFNVFKKKMQMYTDFKLFCNVNIY